MARRHEAERLLRGGLYPSQIASEMGITLKSVIPYLLTRVGEGALRLSDIYFAFPAHKREVLWQVLDGEAKRGRIDFPRLSDSCLSRQEYELFKGLVHRRVLAGDLYVYISDIEVTVHKMVRRTLEAKFGDQENGWWRQGVSENIRKECAKRREEDHQPCGSPFAYTNLLQLSDIISDKWPLFSDRVPQDYGTSRKVLKADFRRLNMIRNAVMHPVRERNWSEDDFQFVKDMHERFLRNNPTQQPAGGDADDRAPQP